VIKRLNVWRNYQKMG